MTEQVWVVDDDSAIRWVLEKALTSAEISCTSFASADSVWQAIEYQQPQVILSDIRMPGTDGLALLEKLSLHYPNLPVIIMTAHSDLDSAVNAYQAGAFEYLPKPFDVDEMLALVERALAKHVGKSSPKASEPLINTPELIGEAPAMQEVFRAIGRLSRSSVSVLINGESGTGKELVAHALHKHSPRKERPFIALNMAAIPHELIESELFGHEKGAFTGAQQAREGRFEQANGGTLFLDEIGDMPLDVQTRLLRVLADGTFYRVGGHQAVNVDVRIIAATHKDLETLVRKGKFREDLFHRLNVIRIPLPPLANRSEDIPKLAEHFLRMAAKEMGEPVKTLTKSCILRLQSLPWPGNVRQLENVCRWLTVMASGEEVLESDLPEDLLRTLPIDVTTDSDNWQKPLKNWTMQQLQAGEEGLLTQAQQALEHILIQAALEHTHGHKQAAAKLLGCGRNTITRKLK
ncbi:nitrogen regulation protein NR(I) [Parashewanella curva]|uniref:DNA-binding transcriptional regulator NtrC n=1 Tax=Parashewanella curva TaxID=2338552 RepID=A0A3L8PZC7_9GAMM|nr:nitrogen regulation protein NR(I) [Parashewanella curva]RLV60757.1 nitrogen regulation protein NR(I) [Parashewanella curva]